MVNAWSAWASRGVLVDLRSHMASMGSVDFRCAAHLGFHCHAPCQLFTVHPYRRVRSMEGVRAMSDERKVPRRGCTESHHVWLEEDVDARCECGKFSHSDWNNPDISRVTFEVEEDAPTVPCIVTDEESPPKGGTVCTCMADEEYCYNAHTRERCPVHGLDAVFRAAQLLEADKRLATELQQLLDLHPTTLPPWGARLIKQAIERLKR